jgi:Resolvase, N terminal domain
LLVNKIDRLARSTSDLYRTVATLAEKGVEFKVIDDPLIDTTTRTGKLRSQTAPCARNYSRSSPRWHHRSGNHASDWLVKGVGRPKGVV